MALFHVWFATKRRRPVLLEDTRDNVRWSFARISREAGIDLIECEAYFDHAHILLRIGNGQRLSELMRRLKGGSSREAFLNSPDLRNDMGQYFWQRATAIGSFRRSS